MPSPAVASPFVPLSKSVCVADPPIGVRFAVTVLAGSVPGLVVTKTKVMLPVQAGFGFASPLPVGGVPPHVDELLLLRGFGAPTAKSAELLSVSVQPPLARSTAVVLAGAGAGALPSKQFAVAP